MEGAIIYQRLQVSRWTEATMLGKGSGRQECGPSQSLAIKGSGNNWVGRSGQGTVFLNLFGREREGQSMPQMHKQGER